MFEAVAKIFEQIAEYSTVFGQLWYLCVFVFRLIVVVTIGGDVYSDEQSEFKCSTEVVGCTNVCFTKFTKISHIRFWGFQLLAVATPALLFHVFEIGIRTRIERMKSDAKEEAERAEEHLTHEHEDMYGEHHKRKRGVGKIHVRKIYDENAHALKEVAYTDSINIAYFLTVIARCALEGIFMYLSYGLFNFMEEDNGPFDFFYYRVPALYKCSGDDLKHGCYQHLAFSDNDFVPCWVSRPWEKTIFLRYMNIFSVICFLLSVIEFFYLIYRGLRILRMRQLRKKKKENALPVHASTPQYNETGFTSLAVPIDLESIKRHPQTGGYYVAIPANRLCSPPSE